MLRTMLLTCILHAYLSLSMDLTNPEEVVSTQQPTTPSDDITFSQSCDLDLHEQPIGLEGVSRRPVPKRGRDREVLVDEEAVRQSMELSQRLSEDAIGTQD